MSGMAGKVRRSADDNEFDLANFTREKCMQLCREAFTEPFQLPKMIKITFVLGGGKEVRQKYRDELVREFCESLNAVGFIEDNAADKDLSAAGKYKYQHDTSKNLKFVHVFPKVEIPAAKDGDEEAEEAPARPRDPSTVLAECGFADFRRMVNDRVVTYTTRRRLLDQLKARSSKMEECEQKLIARQEMNDEEQDIYNYSTEIAEKVKHLAGELQSMVDAGRLTRVEQQAVVEQLGAKLKTLDAELAKAAADGKAKAVAKMEEAKEKLKSTLEAATSASPLPEPAVRYANELRTLKAKLAGIARLEKECNGKFTIDQLKVIGEKTEMQEAFDEYKSRCRIWLETDEELAARLEQCLRVAAPKAKSRPVTPSDGFSTVGKKKR